MRNSVKGVLAAGAAVALLAGGGGTLAFWSDSKTIGGITAVNSGSLALTEDTCGAWLLDGGEPFSIQEIVPGDVLTRTCTYTVDAEGDHLTADVDVSGGTDSGAADLIDELHPSVELSMVGHTGNVTTITSADDDKTLTAVVSLTFTDSGIVDNSGMSLTAVLDDVSIVATQAHG